MVIVAQQKLDWTALRALRPAVARAVDGAEGTPIHVDLSGVTAMEPAGIGALVVLSEFASRKRNTLVLDGVAPRFDALLRECGLALADASSNTHA